MSNNTHTTLKAMMKDFMFYGYNFQGFLNFKYPVCEPFTRDELKTIWTETRTALERM